MNTFLIMFGVGLISFVAGYWGGDHDRRKFQDRQWAVVCHALELPTDSTLGEVLVCIWSSK